MQRRKLLLALGALTLAPLASAATLAETLAKASRKGRFRPSSADTLDEAEALFSAILAAAPRERIEAQATALGMRWRQREDGTQLLVEAPGERHGRGLYAFRPQAPLRRVLQMPHAFKDLHTRRIGLELFAGGGFQAACWNTVPRWRKRMGRRLDSDLAHHPASWFTPFTRALAARPERLTVIQLHGFDAARRNSPLAVVLSNGTRRPDAALRRLARCIESEIDRPVALYPLQADFLGGTTNAQLAALRGRQRFVHVEMDRRLREQLRRDPAALARCLTGDVT